MFAVAWASLFLVGGSMGAGEAAGQGQPRFAQHAQGLCPWRSAEASMAQLWNGNAHHLCLIVFLAGLGGAVSAVVERVARGRLRQRTLSHGT